MTNFVGGCRQGVPILDKPVADIKLLLANNAASYVFIFLGAGQRVRIRGGRLDGIEELPVARVIETGSFRRANTAIASYQYRRLRC